MATPLVLPIKRTATGRWEDFGSYPGTSGSVQMGFDAADISDIVLPLVNDSTTADAQPFTYRVSFSVAPFPPPPATARLALSRFRVSPARFRIGAGAPKIAKVPVGTTFRCTLSEAGRVQFKFIRLVTKHHTHRRIGAGSFRVKAKAGANKVKFMGRLSKRRALKPGRYIVQAKGTASDDRTTRTLTAHFTLLPR
jgi:hypothetical protein